MAVQRNPAKAPSAVPKSADAASREASGEMAEWLKAHAWKAGLCPKSSAAALNQMVSFGQSPYDVDAAPLIKRLVQIVRPSNRASQLRYAQESVHRASKTLRGWMPGKKSLSSLLQDFPDVDRRRTIPPALCAPKTLSELMT